MKKIALILLFALCLFSAGARDLTILHTNDTHSHIDAERSGRLKGKGGVIERAAFVDSVRAAEGRRNVLLLDAGDFGQGTSYFPVLNGDIEIDVINAIGYDAVCLGNHEFDNGLDELAKRVKNLRCDVLCANYDFSGLELGKYVKAYSIFRRAGLKIGVIGLLTDVRAVVDADIAEVMRYNDYVEVANRYADFLKNEKNCDLVICLTHIGYDGPDSDCTLAEKSRNVDVIIGGHSHTNLKEKSLVKNLDGKDVTIVTDGSWGIFVGKLTIKR